MVNTVIKSFKKLNNLEAIGITPDSNFEEFYEEFFNSGEINEANIILENADLITKKIHTKSSVQVNNYSIYTPDEVRKSKLKFIELAIRQKNLNIYHDMATELYLTNDEEFARELVELSYRAIPKEENNHITEEETKISEFGDHVLSSRNLSLKTKKEFISKIHTINPKFSKDIIAIYNLNNMHKGLGIAEKIDFVEILSYFNDIAKFGDPSSKHYNIINKFPVSHCGINYSPLVEKSMKLVPEHKIDLQALDNDIDLYKLYKLNYNLLKKIEHEEKIDIIEKVKELRGKIDNEKFKNGSYIMLNLEMLIRNSSKER